MQGFEWIVLMTLRALGYLLLPSDSSAHSLQIAHQLTVFQVEELQRLLLLDPEKIAPVYSFGVSLNTAPRQFPYSEATTQWQQ